MKLEAYGNSWKFSAGSSPNSWVLSDVRKGEDLFELQTALLNNISEADALQEKCRFHGKLDNQEVEVESLSVYPFGGESAIGRTHNLRGNLLEVKVDIKPGRSEVVRNLELEDAVFYGEFTKAEMLSTMPEPGKNWEFAQLNLADGTIWQHTTPFAVLLLTRADGTVLEMGSGGDWWRTCGTGNTAWSIVKAADKIIVKRKVIAIADDVEIERRPWRFNYYIAWNKTSAAAICAGKDDIILEFDPQAAGNCFAAPAVRKYLRKLIRQQLDKPGNVVLQVPDVKSCDDAAHLERPGKKQLRHWDMCELFALYSWGNRALGEDRSLVIRLPQESVFSKLPSGKYLANLPSLAAVREL
ncbi:MAG: hypothetical protein J6Q81_06255 [Lentisphaeria bacterium]|nr:hypothetical protein [Lentisphaeria bacterium]